MEQSAPQPQTQPKPMLQKPPGYRDPNSKSSAQRKPPLPPSFRPKPKRRSCCRICCCTCCIVILLLLLALLIAAGLFYLIYDPSLPEFHLSSFRITKFNVSDGSDGAYLNADTAMRVEVKNRSGKMRWRFARSRVSISAEKGELDLGSSNVAGFSVKEKGVVELKVETRVRDRALNERQRRRLKIKSVVESKALVPSLELRTKTGVALQGWNSPSLSVTIVCGGVTMRQLQNGDPPLCSITLLNWIKF